MTTTDKVLKALRDGQRTAEELARETMLSGSQVSSAIRVLQNRGNVGYTVEGGRRFYYLTGGA